MYLGISIENFVTIGVMLLAWMLLLHVIGQFGVHLTSFLPGG
jgi:hypothetical protein